jgi:hypothetical protein
MAHKTPIVVKTYDQSKSQREKLGREEIYTFSQGGELYDYSKFTPKKLMKPKVVRHGL